MPGIVKSVRLITGVSPAHSMGITSGTDISAPRKGMRAVKSQRLSLPGTLLTRSIV